MKRLHESSSCYFPTGKGADEHRSLIKHIENFKGQQANPVMRQAKQMLKAEHMKKWTTVVGEMESMKEELYKFLEKPDFLTIFEIKKVRAIRDLLKGLKERSSDDERMAKILQLNYVAYFNDVLSCLYGCLLDSAIRLMFTSKLEEMFQFYNEKVELCGEVIMELLDGMLVQIKTTSKPHVISGLLKSSEGTLLLWMKLYPLHNILSPTLNMAEKWSKRFTVLCMMEQYDKAYDLVGNYGNP